MLSAINTVLVSRRLLAENVWLFDFGLKNTSVFSFVPGQYVILRVPDSSGQFAPRLYSVANLPENTEKIELIVKTIKGGLASSYFSSLGVGTEVVFEGPAGRFQLSEEARQKNFLATGTGIAPVRPMLAAALQSGVVCRLYWGLPRRSDAYLLEEFSAYKKRFPGFDYKICLSKESIDDGVFASGHIDACIAGTGLNAAESDFYICGNRSIVEHLKNSAISLGADSKRVYFEKY